mgnify:CR=1 FL=1
MLLKTFMDLLKRKVRILRVHKNLSKKNKKPHLKLVSNGVSCLGTIVKTAPHYLNLIYLRFPMYFNTKYISVAKEPKAATK